MVLLMCETKSNKQNKQTNNDGYQRGRRRRENQDVKEGQTRGEERRLDFRDEHAMKHTDDVL